MNRKLVLGFVYLVVFCLTLVGMSYAAKLSVGVDVSFPVDI